MSEETAVQAPQEGKVEAKTKEDEVKSEAAEVGAGTAAQTEAGKEDGGHIVLSEIKRCFPARTCSASSRPAATAGGHKLCDVEEVQQRLSHELTPILEELISALADERERKLKELRKRRKRRGRQPPDIDPFFFIAQRLLRRNSAYSAQDEQRSAEVENKITKWQNIAAVAHETEYVVNRTVKSSINRIDARRKEKERREIERQKKLNSPRNRRRRTRKTSA